MPLLDYSKDHSAMALNIISCLSCLFGSTNHQIVDWALDVDFLPRVRTVLESCLQHHKLIHTALFSLSNLTAGHKSHVKRFIEDEILVSLVIEQLRSDKFQIASESAWVLTNTILIAASDDLQTLVRVYSEGLIHSLCHMLERCNEKG